MCAKQNEHTTLNSHRYTCNEALNLNPKPWTITPAQNFTLGWNYHFYKDGDTLARKFPQVALVRV